MRSKENGSIALCWSCFAVGLDAGMGIGATEANGENKLLAGVQKCLATALVAGEDAGNALDEFLFWRYGLILFRAIWGDAMGNDACDSLM